MTTRRDFAAGALALAVAGTSAASARRVNSTFGGVPIGAITYCYRDLKPADDEDSLAPGIRGCLANGLGEVELWATMVQPPTILQRNGQYEIDPANAAMVQARTDIRRWRIETPQDYWRSIRKRFDHSGLDLFAYSLTLADDFTDAEVEATFRGMRAMGVRLLGTNQTRVAMAQRVAPLAEKHGVKLCFHNHSNLSHDNEIASIDSMQRVLAISRNYMLNLDVGHFVGANLDPVAFVAEHHRRISYLHLKDRKRDNGPNMPWGQGDTPLVELLQLLQRKRWAIRCLIEYEYPGVADPVTEVQHCVDFIRSALALRRA
jgi:sugar phosphate isomerase/epimerase